MSRYDNNSSTGVCYREDPNIVALIDAWAKNNGMTRAAAVRHIVKQRLSKDKYLSKDGI